MGRKGLIFDEHGTRHTAADLLQYANPKGLSVLLHATVEKILFKTKGKSRPLAYGVAFGNKHKAYLKGGKKNEVILSAGALGSPQLLMLSGIGPKEQLDAHKIKIVLEQPFVGKDMADNPMNTIFIPSPVVVEPTIVQLVGITRFGSLREMYIHSFFVFVITKTFLFIIFIILAFTSSGVGCISWLLWVRFLIWMIRSKALA
ncbi:putative glucose-methanol-choline oxidoreductase, FAD/NAD(P)-binding domain superfamily [Helianthus annuus]|nr:putative glucose-methanol-choline oxidoreductase, FAD/NAD(P)-binding domain superfamily [Helianthus annuus]